MSGHEIDISVGADGVAWACPVCNWTGVGHGSEADARAEHARMAIDIHAGFTAPGNDEADSDGAR